MMDNIIYGFWELLAVLGFWIPCDKHLPDAKRWDWVLISYYDPQLTYRYVPRVAEYSHISKTWHDDSDRRGYFLNEMCRVTHWKRIPKDKHLKIK
jgi:hypothetical protein